MSNVVVFSSGGAVAVVIQWKGKMNEINMLSGIEIEIVIYFATNMASVSVLLLV